MNTKKFFCTLAMTALVAGGPVTMTSCDDDDVKTILEIISLFTSSDELNGTTWASYATSNGEQYISMIIAFGNGQVEMYSEDKVDSEGNAVLQSGTYTLDTQNNVLTLSLNTGTLRYTISQYTQGSSMTLTANGKSIRLVPYTGH